LPPIRGACIGSFGVAIGKTVSARDYLAVLAEMHLRLPAVRRPPWLPCLAANTLSEK
jgi:hypothetical protein